MGRTLVLLISLAFIISCSNSPVKQVQQEEATFNDSVPGHYGAMINGENPITGAEMMAMLEHDDSVYVTMKSTIVANCQKTGCWMDLDLGSDKVAKVTFKDYGFFIPLDSKGKTATVEGIAKREIIPVDLQKHYAEDEGKSQEEIDAITGDEIAYTFEAVGVIIED